MQEPEQHHCPSALAIEADRAAKRDALAATEEIKRGRVRMDNPKADRNRRKAQRRAQKKARRVRP